ncbi:MAG TPA: CopD family protein [Bacteroidia bacterium]|jgi:putative copper export protein|nr:CopD family protein [Bacteroidia bacterium]HRU61723.1 CopD family protein [Bacteroidia bacterium]
MMAYQLSVLVHLLAGACWIGGMLFLPLVLLPALKGHPERRRLLLSTGLKFRTVGLAALGILFISGLTNMHFRGIPFSLDFFRHSNYGNLVLWKTVLFLLLIGLNLVHDLAYGRKAVRESAVENPRLVRLARWSGRLTLLISLLMAWLGVIISRGG